MKALLEASRNPFSLLNRLCDDVLMLIGSYAAVLLPTRPLACKSLLVKSSLWHMLKSHCPPVLILSSSCEPRFGLSGLYDTPAVDKSRTKECHESPFWPVTNTARKYTSRPKQSAGCRCFVSRWPSTSQVTATEVGSVSQTFESDVT